MRATRSRARPSPDPNVALEVLNTLSGIAARRRDDAAAFSSPLAAGEHKGLSCATLHADFNGHVAREEMLEESMSECLADPNCNRKEDIAALQKGGVRWG